VDLSSIPTATADSASLALLNLIEVQEAELQLAVWLFASSFLRDQRMGFLYAPNILEETQSACCDFVRVLKLRASILITARSLAKESLGGRFHNAGLPPSPSD